MKYINNNMIFLCMLSMGLFLGSCVQDNLDPDNAPGIGEVIDLTPPEANFTFTQNTRDFTIFSFVNESTSATGQTWTIPDNAILIGEGATLNDVDISVQFPSEGEFEVGLVAQDNVPNSSMILFQTITVMEPEEVIVANQVAAITDNDGSDTGELRYIFPSGLNQGSLSLRVLYQEDETQTLNIGLFNSSNSTSQVIADLRLDEGRITLRDNNGSGTDAGAPNFAVGQFVSVGLTWNTTSTTEAGSYTINVNGVSFGPFVAENGTPGEQVTALSVRLGSNSNMAPFGVLLDDLFISSDEDGIVEVFSDDFQSYSIGSSLDSDDNANSPYASNTFETFVLEAVE